MHLIPQLLNVAPEAGAKNADTPARSGAAAEAAHPTVREDAHETMTPPAPQPAILLLFFFGLFEIFEPV